MYFDIHAHMYKYPFAYDGDKNNLIFPTPEELCRVLDEMGVEKAAILPLVNAEVYVPQSVGEVIEVCNNSNGRFVPFCNLDPRVVHNASDCDMGYLFEFYKEQGCVGLGEVLPNMAFNDPKLQNLFRNCERAGWPLLFDCSGDIGGGYGLWDDPEMPMLDASLSKFSNLVFIGHGLGFWKEFVPADYKGGAIEKDGAVTRLMRDHKNLWVDLSAYSGFGAMTKDIEYTKHFFNEFWDRILFGTDVCYPTVPSHDMIGLIEKLHNEGAIDDNKYEAITHKNAERLLKL